MPCHPEKEVEVEGGCSKRTSPFLPTSEDFVLSEPLVRSGIFFYSTYYRFVYTVVLS